MSIRCNQLPPLVIGFLMAACARPGDVPGESFSDSSALMRLRGHWVLALQSAPRATPGLRLTLLIDSASTTTFYGRVSHFFSGNVGVDPTIFSPFEGTLSADGHVEIPVEAGAPDAPPLYLAGHVDGDTISVGTFTIGGDTVTAEVGRVLLVKEP